MKALFSLNHYFWRYKSLLLWGILTVVVSNIFGVYPPQVVRLAIDWVADLVKVHGLQQGFDSQMSFAGTVGVGLLLFGVIVVALALMRGLFLFFTRQTLIVLSRKIEHDMRRDIYEHYQKLPLSFYRKNSTGDLMARITEDINRVRNYLGPGVMYTINTLTLSVIVIATMLMVNVELTLYTIIPLPILSITIYYVETVVLKRSDKIQEQLSNLNSFTQEIFSGIRVVKAYTREKDFGANFAKESEEYKQRSMGMVKVNAMFFPVVMILIGISTVLTVWIGAEKVVDGSLSLGNIAEFILYVNMLTWPIISIGWVSTLIQRAAASQIRINELLKQQSDIAFPASGPAIETAALRFENVNFTYPHTGIQAIKDMSFEVKPGEKLGILGSTGSGKSTLCNLLPRLFDVDSGQIYLDGRPLQAYSMETLRESIGYAPQDVFLFSETVRENILFGKPEATQAELEEAARKASVYDNIVDFPKGFETVVGERGVTLSGGQKQRIALARAWVRQPQLLVLDDSLSAVDTRTEEAILSGLRKAREENPNMVVLMVSHRISTLQDSDRIIVMEDGRIIEEGTHQSLMDRDGYYAKIQRKQLIEAEMADVPEGV